MGSQPLGLAHYSSPQQTSSQELKMPNPSQKECTWSGRLPHERVGDACISLRGIDQEFWSQGVHDKMSSFLAVKVFFRMHSEVGSTVASWLVRSSPDQAVRVSPGWGHCVVLGQDTNSHSASLHPGV